MPFNKTEVDIHTDYSVQAVDPSWLAQGVKSPKHLMLDPGIVQETESEPVRDEAESAFAIFVVDDNACTRCSVCVERCPSDCLYYARLPEGEGGRRTMAAVPMTQQQDADVE